MPLQARHIPNVICVLRMLLVPPIVLVLLKGDYTLALALIMVAGFSDGLDGFLAKQFNWCSRLGGLLDPLADKLLLVSLFLALTWLGVTPVWLTTVVLARDLVIVSGAAIYNFKIRKVQPEPSKVSKLNTFIQLVFITLVVSREAFGWAIDPAILVTGAGVFVASVVSGLDYVLTWSQRARAA